MGELVMDAAEMIGETVTVAVVDRSEITIITVGDDIYAIANKRAAALKYEGACAGRDASEVQMWTVTAYVWANFRRKLVTFDDVNICEYMNAYCSCLAGCREECTCGRW